MAEDKKAFVVYADWESQFDLLSDEEAGKLIKHIFSYVNDKNPEFDHNERLLIMAFEPIKKQLKRDLKRYENTKSERSNSGVIGNLKRWHIDLYKMYENKEITLEEAQKIANARNKSLCDNSDTSKSQKVANIAVTVKDTVTVTDIVTDTVSVINNIEESPTQNFSQFGKKPIKKLKESCVGYSEWLNTIAKKNSLLVHDVLEWLDAFELHILGSGKIEETEQEFKRYFNSWISSEIRQGRKPKVENQSKDAPQKTHEQIAQEVIIKKYGNRAH